MSDFDKKTEFNGLTVKVRPGGSPTIATLLNNTIFGTEGRLRYRQNDIVERMKSQLHLEFIEIAKAQRVLGTAGIAHRKTYTGTQPISTLYVRYLAIAKGFTNRKSTRTKRDVKAKDKATNSTLRDEITALLTHHFEEPFLDSGEEGIFYAYVESHNENSRNLCLSLDFKPVREVETLLFSRFNPKQKNNIGTISEFDKDEVRDQLKKYYSSHSLYFEDRLFDVGLYLVQRVKGQIVGGIRVNPVHWQLVDYPGFEGWLMKNILPFIPCTNRLFQSNEFKFLSIDYVWTAPGFESSLFDLMEHACSLFGIHVGLIWGDSKSEFLMHLKQSNKLGFMHSINGTVKADLMVRNIPTDGVNVAQINTKPVFVSALDMT